MNRNLEDWTREHSSVTGVTRSCSTWPLATSMSGLPYRPANIDVLASPRGSN